MALHDLEIDVYTMFPSQPGHWRWQLLRTVELDAYAPRRSLGKVRVRASDRTFPTEQDARDDAERALTLLKGRLSVP